MLRLSTVILTILALARGALAQEADYSEDRVAPSRVPASFKNTAEKEAGAVRLSMVYKDNEKDYRFVGKANDGRTFSIKLDREGKFVWRRIYTNIASAKLPKAVTATLQNELMHKKELVGFQAARTSLVERFDALKNETTTYYEVFGHTPGNVHPRFEIDASGKLLQLSTSFIPSTSDYTARESLTAKNTPAQVLEGVNEAAPGVTILKIFRVTSNGSNDVSYEAFGRVGRGRTVEVWSGSNGRPYIIAMSVPLREVDKGALDAIKRAADTEKRLVGFQPTEARILRLLALEQDDFEFFGDDSEGEPLQVRVNAKGGVTAERDSREILREEAGISPVGARPRKAVPAVQGFAVLAVRYGVDHHWMDITEPVRTAAAAGRKRFTIEGLPDPAFGRHKTMVMAYSNAGRIGLAQARDDAALSLEPGQDSSSLAEVPSQGFAVLTASFGFEEKWQDVTGAVRSRVASGRLDFKPAEAQFPDPAPGAPKSLAVAYAIDGNAGLYVQSQWRSPNLPFDAPPLNSGALLNRSIEFPQNPSMAAFTPDGRSVVVGVADGSIRMIDITNGREAHRLDGHKPGWLPVALSGNGSLIVSGASDGAVRVWDVKTEREKAVMRGHTDRVQRVAFSLTNRHVASTGWDWTVRLWDVASGRELRKFEGHRELVDGLKFTPDGRKLVTAGWDKTVRIWDVSTGRELQKLQTNGDALSDLALSRTGRDVFFGSKDGLMRVWAPAANGDPVTFPVYGAAEWAIAALPDGRRVLFADTISAAIWDCKTLHPVVRLEEHAGRVTGVAVAPDGRHAVTCGEDKTLKIWNLSDLGKPR